LWENHTFLKEIFLGAILRAVGVGLIIVFAPPIHAFQLKRQIRIASQRVKPKTLDTRAANFSN
jgi:hypothetical protein